MQHVAISSSSYRKVKQGKSWCYQHSVKDSEKWKSIVGGGYTTALVIMLIIKAV